MKGSPFAPDDSSCMSEMKCSSQARNGFELQLEPFQVLFDRITSQQIDFAFLHALIQICYFEAAAVC